MMSWGFWLLFAIGLCAIAEGGMRIEQWWRRRRYVAAVRKRLKEAA